mmetsp:Transcript_122737/g.354782  ORF Transcript_122737/g.354782 Transcript_122737/m.354782 type:complete len:205 (-) Transcript_122737:308-922(-)
MQARHQRGGGVARVVRLAAQIRHFRVDAQHADDLHSLADPQGVGVGIVDLDDACCGDAMAPALLPRQREVQTERVSVDPARELRLNGRSRSRLPNWRRGALRHHRHLLGRHVHVVLGLPALPRPPRALRRRRCGAVLGSSARRGLERPSCLAGDRDAVAGASLAEGGRAEVPELTAGAGLHALAVLRRDEPWRLAGALLDLFEA